MTTATKSDIINRLLDSYNHDLEYLGASLGDVTNWREKVADLDAQIAVVRAEATRDLDGKNETERQANLIIRLAEDQVYRDLQERRREAERELSLARDAVTSYEHRITLHRKACDLYAALYRGGGDA